MEKARIIRRFARSLKDETNSQRAGQKNKNSHPGRVEIGNYGIH